MAQNPVLHFLMLILNLTVITNSITVALSDCEILCFIDQCIETKYLKDSC